MLKKIILGTMFVGFTGLLVWGGINRTRDQATKTAEAAGNGGSGNVSGGNGHSQGRPEVNAGGSGGRGANARLSQSAIGQAQVEAWVELDAEVAAVDETVLTVTLVDGQTYLIEGRPWRFALEQGFRAEIGQQLRLTGFYEDTALELGQIENLSTNQITSIRNETGRPLWAGGGNPR